MAERKVLGNAIRGARIQELIECSVISYLDNGCLKLTLKTLDGEESINITLNNKGVPIRIQQSIVTKITMTADELPLFFYKKEQ